MSDNNQLKLVAYMFVFYDEHPRINSDGKPIVTQAEGEVWYRILDGDTQRHFIQQFHKGSSIPAKDDIGNIWEWDGNKKNPTIRPSFLIRDYHFHCYVTNGKIDILPDSKVINNSVRMDWDEFFGE